MWLEWSEEERIREVFVGYVCGVREQAVRKLAVLMFLC